MHSGETFLLVVIEGTLSCQHAAICNSLADACCNLISEQRDMLLRKVCKIIINCHQISCFNTYKCTKLINNGTWQHIMSHIW